MKSAIIPASETFTAKQLREYFGIYPQLRFKWSRTRGFPKPNERGEYKSSDVIASMRRYGWTVEVV